MYDSIEAYFTEKRRILDLPEDDDFDIEELGALDARPRSTGTSSRSHFPSSSDHDKRSEPRPSHVRSDALVLNAAANVSVTPTSVSMRHHTTQLK